jgi:phage-related protein
MKLQGFAGGLTSLSQAGKVSISSTLGKHLMEVAQAGDYFQQHSAGMSAMSSALETLGQVSRVSISSTLGSHLIDLAIGLEEVGKVNITGVTQITTALSALSGLKITATTVKNLRELGSAAETLVGRDFSGLEKLNQQLTQMAQSLPKVAENIPALNQALGQLDKQTEETSESAERAANSYTNLYAAFQLARHAITAATRTIAGWIDKSNSYIENVNLFTASMGEYAEEAQAYAEKVGDLMGIDPGAWMRNQGVFQTLSTGFGVAADRAAIMSKNLTQLGYDLSSFFNVAVEGEGGAMQKLQAGLAGELEPLRRLGFDLSEARLKAVALSLGIDKTYKSMTQAEKAQLRYYAIMNQVTIAQGDMARTLNSPANQLRILKAQVEQAARALGNVFIPLLNAVLPYLIAAAKAVRILASAIASLFGFEMPEVDYSGISAAASASEDLSAGLGKSAKNAKKLNELLADWDELNIIASEDNSNKSGSGAGGGGAGGFDFDLPEYDFLAGLVESNVGKIMDTLKPALDWMQEHIKAVVDLAELLGMAFLAWKINKTLTGDIGGVIKWVLGLALVVWGLSKAYEAFEDQWNNGVTFENMASLFKYLGVLSIGLWFMFGKKGLGIGLLVSGITAAIEPIKEFINTGELTTEAFLQLEAAIGAIGIGLSLLTGNWIPLVVGAIVGIALAIYQNWDEVKAYWNGTVVPYLEQIWNWINTNIIQPIISGVIDIYNNVVSWVTSTYNAVAKWVSDLCNSVVQWVSETYQSIATWVTNAYNTVTTWVENTYNSVATWFKSIYDTVAEWISSAYNTVSTWVMDIYNSVVGWVTDTYNSVSDAVRNTYNSVVSWVEDIYNSVVGWASTAYTDVVAWVTNLYNSVVGWVINTYNDVVAWFNNIYTGITSAIAGVAGWIDVNVLQPVLYIFESLYLGILKDIENVGTWWTSTVEPWINSIIAWVETTIFGYINEQWNEIVRAAQEAWDELTSLWNDTISPFLDSIVTFFTTDFINYLTDRWNDIVDGANEAWNELCSLWDDTIVPFFEGIVNFFTTDFVNYLAEQWNGIVAGAEEAWEELCNLWDNIIVPFFDGIMDFFATDFVNYLSDRWDEIVRGAGEAWDELTALWDNVIAPMFQSAVTWLDETFVQPIAGFAKYIYDSFWEWIERVRTDGLFTTLVTDIKAVFESLISWFNENVIQRLVDEFNWLKDQVLGIFQAIASWWNQTIAPLLGISASESWKTPVSGRGYVGYAPGGGAGGGGGSNFGYLAFHAEGGFPESGEMFFARENGIPELVGSIGNRTAVANNEQIEAGIAEGVREANSEQNSLLEVANQYLRIIASKSGSGGLRPSIDLARTVKRSEELRLMAEGV